MIMPVVVYMVMSGAIRMRMAVGVTLLPVEIADAYNCINKPESYQQPGSDVTSERFKKLKSGERNASSNPNEPKDD